jgi:hypothetical protein
MPLEAAAPGSVLSDRTIRKHLGDLIENAVLKNATQAGYEFFPGKLYPPGEDREGREGQPIDWTVPGLPPEESYAVKRGELLLVRTRERVKMPKNLCGLWSQLDRNSRQGLLLVNMSVVPPGYEGFLTCTFVNFGSRPRLLKPTLPIARLLFLRLDGEAEETGRAVPPADYDERMSEAAREAPKTFLALAEHAAELVSIVEGAKQTLEKKAEELATGKAKVLEKEVTDAKAAIAATSESERRALTATLQADAKGAVKAAFPWALLALALLVLVQAGGTWLSTKLNLDLDRLARQRADQIEAQIDQQLAAIGGRKPVFVYTGSVEAKALADRIHSLEEQVRALKAKGSSAAKSP